MVPRSVGGRPSGVVCQYWKNGGVSGAEGKAYGGAAGCKHKKSNGTFQSSKWANHVVLQCLFHTGEVKAKVAAAQQTKKIQSDYVPPMPAWLKPQQVKSVEQYTAHRSTQVKVSASLFVRNPCYTSTNVGSLAA